MYEACRDSAMPLDEFVVFAFAYPGDLNLCHAPRQQLRLGAETTSITIFHMMEEPILVKVLRNDPHVYDVPFL